MTAHADLETAKSHMRRLMHVLKADAKEKHYSYSAAKSEVMVIGAASAARRALAGSARVSVG